MTEKDGVKTFYAEDQETWRAWLEANHKAEKSVWLIIYHKDSHTPSVYYEEAVDEALCFGWIDSKPNKRDHESFFQFFSQRNPKSNWSRKNKLKVQKLIKEGKMHTSGFEMIKIARQSGTWTALDEVENLVIPFDLQEAFDLHPEAFKNFQAFPPSAKRGILEWILNAKKPETRQKRIEETVTKAARNIRANNYRP
ncbi:MAG: YdeI/OmpD-associated family protein [Microscillaceae bacterium]|nr:YdeI/OmpD-associated family protein [Microscillaceae bacterium]